MVGLEFLFGRAIWFRGSFLCGILHAILVRKHKLFILKNREALWRLGRSLEVKPWSSTPCLAIPNKGVTMIWLWTRGAVHPQHPTPPPPAAGRKVPTIWWPCPARFFPYKKKEGALSWWIRSFGVKYNSPYGDERMRPLGAADAPTCECQLAPNIGRNLYWMSKEDKEGDD